MGETQRQEARRRSVLVSDFDGTLAHPEFYELVSERLVPPETPDYWMEYRAGRMTHFDALRRYFSAAEGGEQALIEAMHAMELEPRLPELLSALRRRGWEVVVVSAGCDWYIRQLLAEAHVELPVYANPGHIEAGRLIMEPPTDSEVFSPQMGIDKLAVVQSLQAQHLAVAFAGDGLSDLEAALAVRERLRFARGDLASALRERDAPFRPFARWSEVAEALLMETEEQ